MSFYFFFCSGMLITSLIGEFFDSHIPIALNHKRIDFFWKLMIIACLVVLGMREVYTKDHYAYSRGFELMKMGNWDLYYSHDLLFLAVCWMAIRIGGNIHTVYFICALLSIGFLYKALEKLNCNKYLYLSFYLLTFQFFDQFNIVRQGVAISICFYAVVSYLLNEKNFKKYLILVIVATLFHISAIVMIPTFFIVQRKISFPVIVGSVMGGYLLSSGLVNIQVIQTIFGSIWIDQYTKQFDYALITVSEVIIAICIIALRKKIALNDNDNIILNLTWLFPLFRMGAANFFILHRLSKYYINFYILSLLMVSRIGEGKNRKVILAIEIMFYFTWFCFYIHDYKSFFPYNLLNLSYVLGLD